MPRKSKDAPPRDDVAVKIERNIWKLASAVAGFRGVHLAEYVSDLLRPMVARDFDAIGKEQQRRTRD